jgi:riboflavin kinase/FMN adenylyltransferase
MVNIGVNPTFNRGSLAVEAHLLGFERNIYGEVLRVNLVDRIRDEERFSDAEALKARLAKDLQITSKMPLAVRGLSYSSAI